MEIDKFVKELRLLAPLRQDFRIYNVPDVFIEESIQRYICIPRSKRQERVISKDPVLDLLQSYDCSKIGIGNISFLNDVIDKADFYKLGNVEADILVLNKITLGVEVRDYQSEKHVMWKCARNSASFLEALLVCARCLKYIFLNLELGDNSAFILEHVNASAEKAGGEEFINFYRMLLGYVD